ncbi:hypothetical protein [Streptomyces sp. NPDC002746]
MAEVLLHLIEVAPMALLNICKVLSSAACSSGVSAAAGSNDDPEKSASPSTGGTPSPPTFSPVPEWLAPLSNEPVS